MSIQKPHLIVVGQGNMAELIVRLGGKEDLNVTQAKELPFPGVVWPESVVLHVGSGRLLNPAIGFCRANGLPLIQASSGIDLSKHETNGVAIVDAPNLGLPIAALFGITPQLGEMMKILGAQVSVTESHQSSKTSVPITAQKIAADFGMPTGSVKSIRDREHQRDVLGVPTEHLSGHAYHIIDIKACGVDVQISLKIHGRDPYFYGAVAVANKLLQLKKDGQLLPEIYPVASFMF